MPKVASINHDPCYHRLPCLSNGIIVLVFSELASFVRKILQREENKGVELTVHRGNCLREGSSESKRGKRQLPHFCTTRKNGAPAKSKACPTCLPVVAQSRNSLWIILQAPLEEIHCGRLVKDGRVNDV